MKRILLWGLVIVLVAMIARHHTITAPGPATSPGAHTIHNPFGPVIRCDDNGRPVSVQPDTPNNRAIAEQLCKPAAGN